MALQSVLSDRDSPAENPSEISCHLGRRADAGRILMAQAYTEASIKTLSSLEHIRLRPGMYIGRLGNGAHAEDGIYVLL